VILKLRSLILGSLLVAINSKDLEVNTGISAYEHGRGSSLTKRAESFLSDDASKTTRFARSSSSAHSTSSPLSYLDGILRIFDADCQLVVVHDNSDKNSPYIDGIVGMKYPTVVRKL